MKKWGCVLAAAAVFLAGCSESTTETLQAASVSSEAKPAEPTAAISELLKAASDSVASTSIDKIMFDAKGEPVQSPLFYAEVTFTKDFVWGSAQDWNGLASALDGVARKAFEREDVWRLRFKVVSSKGDDWAYVDFRRNRLPADWKDGSYLQRFAAADASSPYPQASDALCKFYEKYESAKPKQNAPCITK